MKPGICNYALCFFFSDSGSQIKELSNYNVKSAYLFVSHFSFLVVCCRNLDRLLFVVSLMQFETFVKVTKGLTSSVEAYFFPLLMNGAKSKQEQPRFKSFQCTGDC